MSECLCQPISFVSGSGSLAEYILCVGYSVLLTEQIWFFCVSCQHDAWKEAESEG
jgi:hypothetical protein